MQQSANSKPAPYSNSNQTKIVTPLFKWLCLLCIISVGFIVDFLYFVDISQQSTTTAIKTKISKGNQPNASLKVGDDLNITKNDIDHPIGDNRNEPRIIHWNAPDRKSKPTIYYCHPNNGNGMKEIKTLMTSVLPEYQRIQLKPQKNKMEELETYLEMNYTNEYDIFVSHFEQYCESVVERWMHTHFNGHIVLFSGESRYNHPIKGNTDTTGKIHAFGPIQDKYEDGWEAREGDMRLYYLQLTWWQYFQDSLSPSSMISSKERPRGNVTVIEGATVTKISTAANKHFMIYANSHCVEFREIAVGRLSEIGIIHCDGKCQGKVTTVGGNQTNLINTKHTSNIGVGNWWGNIERYSNYRFCFVMEHTADHPGYITEKIILAYAAGCIPIYYGPESIFDIFNEKSFVFYNISDPQPALDLVQRLEDDLELYDEMMNQNIVLDGETTIEDYFSFSDQVGNGVLKERMRKKLGLANFLP